MNKADIEGTLKQANKDSILQVKYKDPKNEKPILVKLKADGCYHDGSYLFAWEITTNRRIIISIDKISSISIVK
jgi:hypothetical protein